MSTYAGGGSRGFQPDPKVVAAATLIHTAKMNNMRAPTAKKAMAGLFSEDEINDESKQRNVRRTAQKMEEQAAEAAAEATGTATASTTAKRSSSTAGSKSNKKKKQAAKQGPTTKKASKSSSVTPPPPIKNAASAPKAYTLTSKQVVQQEAADKKQQAKYNDAFAEATTMWAEEKTKPEGEGMTSKQVADEMEKKHNVKIPASSIRDAVNKGRVGEPNLKRGPKGKIDEGDFHTLSEALITLTTLRQASGESELDSVAVKELLRGLLKGTDKASMDVDALYKRYRAEVAPFVSANKVSHSELRRQLWTSDTNLGIWYDNWKKFVVEEGFAMDEPEYDEDGALVSEVTFPEAQKRRIINLDETRITADGADGTREYGWRNVRPTPARRK